MWIKKKEIEQLSEFVKGYSSGEELDIRVNKEGSFNILKNDIYALVNTKNEQIKAVETERDSLSDYMADISHQLKNTDYFHDDYGGFIGGGRAGKTDRVHS